MSSFSTPFRGRAPLAALFAVAAAALSVLPSSAAAATLRVPGQHRTLDAAYRAAHAGDTIRLAAGVHGPQHVSGGSKRVTFRGKPGAVVRELDNDASNVTFAGIDVDAGATTVTAFENHGGDNVKFRDAAIGNVVDTKAVQVSGRNFTFDRVLFHDAEMRTDGTHMECVYAIGVPGMTVRNSTFRDCAVMDLFLTYGSWWSPLPPAYGGIRLENNVFGHPERTDNRGWHYYSLYVADNGPGGRRVLDGWVVRNNTFESPAELPDSGSGGARWVGNVGSWDCVDGVEYRRNVGKRCNRSDKAVSPAASSASSTAAFGWVDPAAGNFRLERGSPAVGAADRDDHPARDRSGRRRDRRPDAGAFERVSRGTKGSLRRALGSAP